MWYYQCWLWSLLTMLKDLMNWDIDKKQVLKWDQISNIVQHNQSSLLPQLPQIVRFIQFLLLFYVWNSYKLKT